MYLTKGVSRHTPEHTEDSESTIQAVSVTQGSGTSRRLQTQVIRVKALQPCEERTNTLPHPRSTAHSAAARTMALLAFLVGAASLLLQMTLANTIPPPSAPPSPKSVLWLPLGDSITFGCTGPTIQDCHHFAGGYRIPLAFALSQAPLGAPSLVGLNISTMGTLTTGPAFVPPQWLAHEGHPGWQINNVDDILNQSLATSPRPPDLVTIHLGTNDCNANTPVPVMARRMDSLLGHIQARAPKTQVFLASVIATGNPWVACIQAFNALVPNITTTWAAKGLAITYVPMYESVGICGQPGADQDLCGGHQIHPTSAGCVYLLACG